MKINKVLVICICILAVLSIGIVSADDNVADSNQTDSAPNIQVPEKIWKDGDYDITIEADETSEIEISGAINYNSTVNPGTTSIPIKNLTTGRHNICINSNNSQKEYNITVLKENPDWNMDFDFLEDEILYTDPIDHECIDSCVVILNRPEGLTGNFSFYVDGDLYQEWNALEQTDDIYYGAYYEERPYNFTLKYSGDDYFYPASKTRIVEFCPILITIPEEVVSGYDDTIYIRSDYDFRGGNVTIKINNKTVFKMDKINSNEYYMLEYSLKELKPNQQYDIEVSFTSATYNKTKRATVNVSDHVNNYITFMGKYDSTQDSFKYVYGDESNRYYIISPKLDLDIAIDNKTVKSKYKTPSSGDGYYVINIADLDPGTHRITVSYGGDKKYGKNTFANEFEVVVRPNCPAEVEQYETNYLTVELPEDAIGNLTVDFENLDNSDIKYYKTAEVKDSKAVIALPTDHVGHYLLKAYFNGNYELNEITGKYLVKDSATWKLSNEYTLISLNENLTLTLEMAEEGFGNLTVNIEKDGKAYENYTLDVVNGNCKITLPTNHIGKYSIETSFKGNGELIPYRQAYEVSPEYWIDSIDDYDPVYNSTEFVSVELPENGTGTLTLEVKYNENDNYTFYKSAELTEGRAKIQFPTDRVGKVYYNVLYSGNYELYNCTDMETFVIPAYSFKNNIFTLIGDSELSGTFNIIDLSTDKGIDKKIINGTASIDLTNYVTKLNEPTYFILSFIANGNKEHYMGDEKVNPNVMVAAKDITMYYGDSKTFKAKIYRNGKAVGKGEKVTIKIGAKKYKLKTDKKGTVKLKLTQTPKEYKIKTIYRGVSFNNKLTVKQVLTLEKVNIKKSAKKLVLTATLKKGKKPLENKQVTFKFSGKKYAAKTDKKGITKVTIPKAVLNKLKAGKKLTYQATYIKDSVKQTVKIQK